MSAPRCNGAEGEMDTIGSTYISLLKTTSQFATNLIVEFEHSQLLMCYRNEWRGVCDGKKTFNKTDAEVVCYQLGLSGDVINTNFHCDSSDRNVSEIAEFKDVSCTGREEELHDCKMNTRLKNDDCPAEDCICFHCPGGSTTPLQRSTFTKQLHIVFICDIFLYHILAHTTCIPVHVGTHTDITIHTQREREREGEETQNKREGEGGRWEGEGGR